MVFSLRSSVYSPARGPAFLAIAALTVAGLWASPAIAQRGPAPDPLIREGATVKLGPHTYAIPDFSVPMVPNVGIVVGNRATLVVDTGLGRRNGEAILREVGKVSKNTELYIVTTHFHAEHTMGYTAFPPSAKYVNAKQQEADFDEGGMRQVQAFAGRSPLTGELLAGATRRAADITFDKEHVLDLGGVRVRLIMVGPTHTKGDTVAFVEGDGVLFAGDVVMNKSFVVRQCQLQHPRVAGGLRSVRDDEAHEHRARARRHRPWLHPADAARRGAGHPGPRARAEGAGPDRGRDRHHRADGVAGEAAHLGARERRRSAGPVGLRRGPVTDGVGLAPSTIPPALAGPLPRVPYKRIATEEAFGTVEIFDRYRAMLSAAAICDPGFKSAMGYFLLHPSPRARTIAERLADVDARRIGDMDAAGIDLQLLSLTSPGVQVFDRETATALAADANDQLAAAIARHPARFAGLAAIAPQDPSHAAPRDRARR